MNDASRFALAATALAATGPAAYGCVGEIFELNQGTLVAIAYEQITDTLLIYPDFHDEILRYNRSGILLETIPYIFSSSNDIDFDAVQSPLTLNGTPIAVGSILAGNGDHGNRLSAFEPITGVELAFVDMSGVGSTVGLAQHAARGTIYQLGWTDDIIHELDPADGSIVNAYPVAPAGSPAFDVFYGDIEVEESTGDLLLVSSSQSIVRRMSATGDWIEDLDIPGVPDISGIAMDDSRSELWVIDVQGRLVRVINIFGCVVDLTGDGIVDAGDLGAYISAYLANEPLADLTCDGIADSGDLGTFITLYLTGC